MSGATRITNAGGCVARSNSRDSDRAAIASDSGVASAFGHGSCCHVGAACHRGVMAKHWELRLLLLGVLYLVVSSFVESGGSHSDSAVRRGVGEAMPIGFWAPFFAF